MRSHQTRSKQCIHRWTTGQRTPAVPDRAILALPPLCIPTESWDQPPSTEEPSPPAPASPKASPKRTTEPEPQQIVGLVNATDLARDSLQRIAAWRAAAEQEASPAQRREYARLEQQAIKLYAQVSGQATATESELVRSPHWARLRGDILNALKVYPDAAKLVLAVLEANGDPLQS